VPCPVPPFGTKITPVTLVLDPIIFPAASILFPTIFPLPSLSTIVLVIAVYETGIVVIVLFVFPYNTPAVLYVVIPVPP